MGITKPNHQKSTIPEGTKASGASVPWAKLTGGATPLGGQGGKKASQGHGKKKGSY